MSSFNEMLLKTIRLLGSLNIWVVEVGGEYSNELTKVIAIGSPPTNDAAAARISDQLFVFMRRRDLGEQQDLVFLLSLIHEAAHLLTDQFDVEDAGVAQMELYLAKLISEDLFVKLKKMHDEDYGWDQPSYKLAKRTRTWKFGAEFAFKKLESLARGNVHFQKELKRVRRAA
jgi:hypothetical protein